MKSYTVKKSMKNIAPFAKYAIAAAVIHAGAANATVISGSSDAYALGADISAANELLTVDVIAPSGVAGSAPAPYDLSDKASSATLSLKAR